MKEPGCAAREEEEEEDNTTPVRVAMETLVN